MAMRSILSRPRDTHARPTTDSIPWRDATPSERTNASAGTTTVDKYHYAGHRKCLKARFLASDGDGLADYELLELVLARTIPRVDTKPLAKQLIQRFGGFVDVINAEPARSPRSTESVRPRLPR